MYTYINDYISTHDYKVLKVYVILFCFKGVNIFVTL